jgi:hypothetical protein
MMSALKNRQVMENIGKFFATIQASGPGSLKLVVQLQRPGKPRYFSLKGIGVSSSGVFPLDPPDGGERMENGDTVYDLREACVELRDGFKAPGKFELGKILSVELWTEATVQEYFAAATAAAMAQWARKP